MQTRSRRARSTSHGREVRRGQPSTPAGPVPPARNPTHPIRSHPGPRACSCGGGCPRCPPVGVAQPAPSGRPLARGVTRNERARFVGTPSPQLVAHELVHIAQQRLGREMLPTSARPALEAEATRLAPDIAFGRPADVRLAAPVGLALHGTDPDKTYTSTVGLVTDDAYIAAAHEFHEKWGYNPIRVASIEEITQDLAKGTGHVDRIRIVSHASQIGLYMQFVRGGLEEVLQGELEARTQAEGEQAGVVETADYVNASATEAFRKAVIAVDAPLAKRLGITNSGIKSREVRSYFRWLTNRHRLNNLPGLSKSERAPIAPAVTRHLGAARKAALKHKVASPADLDALAAAVAGHGFGWSPMIGSDALGDVIKEASAARTAFVSRGFGERQTRMRARFSNTSVVEVRGCALGQSTDYMKAVQTYFGGTAGKPAVDAPKWYQYYGTLGLYEVPNDDAQIKGHWARWKHRKHLRESFKKWAPVFEPGVKLPATPTWTHLASYLRRGHALPIWHGSRLFVLKGMQESQIIDWFTKNDQRLTKAAEIKNQFTVGSIAKEATNSSVVQWLQEAYTDAPKTRVFSYDPRWRSLFETVAGIP